MRKTNFKFIGWINVIKILLFIIFLSSINCLKIFFYTLISSEFNDAAMKITILSFVVVKYQKEEKMT
jgi:hypothetical protein